MKIVEILNEVFDPNIAYDIKWGPNQYSGGYQANAWSNDLKTPLTVEFRKEWPNLPYIKIVFDVNRKMGITGGGNALPIFATVIKAVKEYVAERQPEYFFFSAEEESRRSLYNSLAKRFIEGYTRVPQKKWPKDFAEEIKYDPEHFANSEVFLFKRM
jgi:hypothetical protein